jgi:hypothetical protein
LVEAGKITNLEYEHPYALDSMLLHAFPWGHEVHRSPSAPLDGFNVAVVHAYIWKKGKSFPGAPMSNHLHKWRKRLRGYKLAVFGDNHKGFVSLDDKTTIVNCGGFMRRNTDEKGHQPKVTLLWHSGKVTRQPLNVEDDVILTVEQVIKAAEENPQVLADFLDSLSDLRNATADFVEAVLRNMDSNTTTPSVRQIVMKALEEKEKK